jgi:excisionase family DNA binding protein
MSIDQTMSVTEAAALTGVSKSAIVRAIHAGKIDADRNSFGDWRIRSDGLKRYRRRNAPVSEVNSIEQRLSHVEELLRQALDELAQIEADRWRRRHE